MANYDSTIYSGSLRDKSLEVANLFTQSEHWVDEQDNEGILGMYDFIVAGYHQTEIDWENRKIQFSTPDDVKYKNIHALFIEMVSKRYELTELNLYAMQLHLFLSMLPSGSLSLHLPIALAHLERPNCRGALRLR
jgi:hypothetical protein